MNFDDLIPFLIFFGIIGYNILKRLAKKKQSSKDGNPPKKAAPKIFTGLSRLVNNIKAEIEKACLELKQQKGEQSASVWEGLSEEKVSEDKEQYENIEEIIEEEKDSSLQPLEIEKEDPAVSSYAVDEQKESSWSSGREVLPDRSFGIRKRKYKKALNLSPFKMREAIVLSEIIAKPVGLRD